MFVWTERDYGCMWKKEVKNKLDLEFRLHMLPMFFICLLNSSLLEVSFFFLTFWEASGFPMKTHLTWTISNTSGKCQIILKHRSKLSLQAALHCHQPNRVRIIFSHSTTSLPAFSELWNLVSFVEHDSTDLSRPVSCRLWYAMFPSEGSTALVQHLPIKPACHSRFNGKELCLKEVQVFFSFLMLFYW